LASALCQTVGDELFFYLAYVLRSWQNTRFASRIWQTLGYALSNSNSLANQLGIHQILAKQEKLASNNLANQLGKIETWKNSPPHAHICARRLWLPSAFPGRWEGKKIKNREGFLI
jgi:hypothetical protein